MLWLCAMGIHRNTYFLSAKGGMELACRNCHTIKLEWLPLGKVA